MPSAQLRNSACRRSRRNFTEAGRTPSQRRPARVGHDRARSLERLPTMRGERRARSPSAPPVPNASPVPNAPADERAKRRGAASTASRTSLWSPQPPRSTPALADRFLHLGTGAAFWATQLMPVSVRFVPAALAGSSPPLARLRSMLSSVRTVSLRTTSLRVIFFIASR